MKKCTKCDINKELTEFHKAIANIDGRHHRCKVCAKAYYDKWANENPDKVKLAKAKSKISAAKYNTKEAKEKRDKIKAIDAEYAIEMTKKLNAKFDLSFYGTSTEYPDTVDYSDCYS